MSAYESRTQAEKPAPEPFPTPLSLPRQPPNSLEAEQSLLGALMLSDRAWDKVSDKIDESDFYRETHRLIYRAAVELSRDHQPTDAVTVADWFAKHDLMDRVEGGAYLTMLANDTPGPSNILGYAEIVREKSILRQLIEIGTEVADAALNPNGMSGQDILGMIEGRVHQVGERIRGRTRSNDHSIQDATRMALEDMQDAAAADGGLRGITTGLQVLDSHLGGWQKGDLTVIGARPAMGKTALMLHFAASAGVPVGVVSAEQPAFQIAQRHASSLGRVSLADIRRGRIGDQEQALLVEALRKINRMKYRIFDRSSPHIADVERQARRWKQQFGLEILLVDYIQRIRGDGDKKHERVGDVVQRLKTLARDLDIPVVALSQVGRQVEQRSNRRPGMGDLSDSSEIEKEADAVITLYRDEVYDDQSQDKGIAELYIAKNRHGYTGTVRVQWAGEWVRFADLATGVAA